MSDTPKPRGGPSSRRLRDAINACRGSMTLAAVFSLALNLLLLVPSLYMLQIYDRVLVSRNETTLLMLSLVTLGLFAMLGGFDWLRSQLLTRVSARLDEALSRDVYRSAFRAKLSGAPVDPAQSLHDLTTLRQFLTGRGIVSLFDVPWAPLYIVVIFMFDAWLGLLALGGTLVLLALAAATEYVSRDPLARAQKLSGQAASAAASQIRNAEAVAAMGMMPRLLERWYVLQHAMLVEQSVAGERAAALAAVSRTFRIVLQSAVLGIGALAAIEGRITPGMMIAASILVGRALAPVEAAIGSWRSVAPARAAYKRLDVLLGSVERLPEPLPMPRPSGAVAIERLTVTAPGNPRPVLKQMEATLAAGEAVAVIGPSGAGKSTLARALVGVWPAQSGAVRLDGTDLRHWDRDTLGQWIGYVPQDVELFDGTIAENIARFGDDDADSITEAAKLAGVHELIQKLPMGYRTPIGSDGSGLSGGQRQRIALARAVYGAPSLVVLDEPNSNLDDEGEQALIEAIRVLKSRGTTVVLITHRKAILSVIDRALVLQDGTISRVAVREGVVEPGLARVSPANDAPPAAAAAQPANQSLRTA
jgi:ATP-binding cassette subfamily C exporter for protease/lipase